MILLFLYALFWTIFIETFVLIFLRELRFFKLHKVRLYKIIFVGIFTSMGTLPYLWLVQNFVLHINNSFNIYILFTIIGETCVVLIEGILYFLIFNIKFKKAIFLSFIVNFISWFIGLFIM